VPTLLCSNIDDPQPRQRRLEARVLRSCDVVMMEHRDGDAGRSPRGGPIGL
jgi:hypothetical protein